MRTIKRFLFHPENVRYPSEYLRGVTRGEFGAEPIRYPPPLPSFEEPYSIPVGPDRIDKVFSYPSRANSIGRNDIGVGNEIGVSYNPLFRLGEYECIENQKEWDL